MSFARKTWETLSEPRFVTGLALTVYAICLGLALDLALQGRPDPLAHWVPPGLLTVGALVAIPCAWVGRWWGKSLEKVGLILLTGGLVTGTIVEVSDLVVANDAAGDYTMALLAICVCLAVGRWIQLTREIHRAHCALLEAVRPAR